MNRKKRSHNPQYSDPSAFGRQFPRIQKSESQTGRAIFLHMVEQGYKMGTLRAVVAPPQEGQPGFFMSVHGRDKYPSWDEIVWLRYNLLPDAAVMSLLLPNLNSYINLEDKDYQYVFTLEQKGYVLDPSPVCEFHPTDNLVMFSMQGVVGAFSCPVCGASTEIDMSTWNEEHGNGFLESLSTERRS